jgi:malonyl CoA-acyl carrier protein transacylase/SAM-dependent methyltransferase
MDGLREPGKMVTVFADEATIAPLIAPYAHHVSIAAINGPDSVVISGQTGAIDTVLALLKTQRIRSRALAVTQASHSPLMEPLLDEFEAVASGVSYQEPLLPMVSTVSGEMIQPGQISQAAYWREHTRRTVQFARAMQTLQQQGARIFVEMGPNPTLLTLGQRCVALEGTKWLPSLREGFDDWQQMLESLAALYVAGVTPNWGAFASLPHRRRLTLPTYPFQRQRYWIEQKAQPHHEVVESLWEIARAAAESQATQGPLELNAASYPAKWQAANQLAHAYQSQTLRALGAFTQAGETHSLAGLLTKFKIEAKYEALLGRWLDTLVTAGWLRRHDELYISDAPLPATDMNKLWHEIGAPLAEIQPLADYLRRSGELLAAVLTGVESPLETLFPGGDYDTVDFLYNKWALARYFNSIIARTVAAVANRQPSKRLQVVEIGAGTGGTSATVLPALPTNRLHYTFTDVSDFFLGRAQARFAAFPFVRYQLLDIEQEPVEQGFAANSFDIVIAANVLHATSNLDRTLQHLRSLLAPGGLLILYEATEHPAWFDITVGLIEGWSKFEDSWRGDHPLLSGERWMETLQANGFESVEVWPKAGNPARNLLHTIVLAQGPTFAASTVEAASNEFVANELVEAISVSEAGASSHLHRQLDEALPGDRVELMIGFVRDHVRRALRVSAAHPLSIRDRLMDLGFDSLMAVELRAKLSSELGLTKTLPATLIFDYPTIEAMAKFLLKRWEERRNGADLDTLESPGNGLAENELTEVEGKHAPTTSDLIEMSDDEIEALLLKKLENI